MKEGDLVLTPLPQADGQVKNRPAVVLRVMPGHGDLLVCGVSTQVHQAIAGFDEFIRPEDAIGAINGTEVQGRRLVAQPSGPKGGSRPA